jgi:hypothetical protein
MMIKGSYRTIGYCSILSEEYARRRAEMVEETEKMAKNHVFFS